MEGPSEYVNPDWDRQDAERAGRLEQMMKPEELLGISREVGGAIKLLMDRESRLRENLAFGEFSKETEALARAERDHIDAARMAMQKYEAFLLENGIKKRG